MIPLDMVDSVNAGWSFVNDPTAGGVKLFGASSNGGFFGGGSGHELLRFDTLGGGGNVFQPNKVGARPNQYSDEVIAQLRALVEWNRKRMAASGEKTRTKQDQVVSGYMASSYYVGMS